MSGHTAAPRPFHPAAAAAASPTGRAGAARDWAARDWARALWARWKLMRRAAETRRELGTLNPRLLSDIGVSRAEAEREAERWPWDTAPRHASGRGTGAHW